MMTPEQHRALSTRYEEKGDLHPFFFTRINRIENDPITDRRKRRSKIDGKKFKKCVECKGNGGRMVKDANKKLEKIQCGFCDGTGKIERQGKKI